MTSPRAARTFTALACGLLLGCAADSDRFRPKALAKTDEAPVVLRRTRDGLWFVDFGRAAFGTIRIRASVPATGGALTVHLGEVVADGRIDREPGGSRRYRVAHQDLLPGTRWYEIAIPKDARNTSGAAVRMPEEVGEVVPFRYCEVEGYPGTLTAADIRQVRVHYPFDGGAATFASSNRVLNDVWELCKYSIEATSFAGVYVDGDRERIPYEGDAYINQLGHYCLDTEYAMARRTLVHLMAHPTWPVEWHQHIPLMVWEEYLYTGATDFLRARYDEIVAKLLLPLAREDGLLVVDESALSAALLHSIGMHGPIRTLVDWPPGERDGHRITPVDSVVNAFHHRGLVLMAEMAAAIGRDGDAHRFRTAAARVHASYQAVFFDPARGIYRDGEGQQHASLHANAFALAFGLVPGDRQAGVVEHLRSRGMACSVYAAQHLIDGLCRAGAGDHALDLMTSTGERSWAHMIYDVGSTITLEAWDDRFKPNQDWNHAWGAAPANLIPRRVMGIMPVEPGFGRVRIAPQIGELTAASIRHPTIRGPIDLRIEQTAESYRVVVKLPDTMTGELALHGENVALVPGEQRLTIPK